MNGAPALLPGKVRVDDQRHPVTRDDVVDVDAAPGQLGQSLTGGHQDSTKEIWIRDSVRLALAVGHGYTEELVGRDASPGRIVFGNILGVRAVTHSW